MRYLSIKKKVIAALLFSGVLPIFAGILLIYSHTSHEFITTLGQNFRQVAFSIAKEVDLRLIEEVNDLKRIADSLEVKWILKTSYEYLKGRKTNDNAYSYVEKFLSSYIVSFFEGTEGLSDFAKNKITQKADILLEEKIKDSKNTVVEQKSIKAYIDNILVSLQKKEKRYLDILIMDPFGRIICSTAQAGDVDVQDKGWWDQVYSNGEGKVYISSVQYSKEYKKYVYQIIVPVVNYDTELLDGVIKVTLDASSIFALIKESSPGKANNIMLVSSTENGSGNVLTDLFSVPLRKQVDISFLYQLESYIGWKLITDKQIKEDFVVGFASIANFNNLWRDSIIDKWYIFVSASKDDVLLPIYILLWQFSLWGGVLVLILCGIGYFLANKIVRPIIQLQEGTEIIGTGDLNYMLTVNTNDEIADLADKFNIMTQRLKSSQEKLQEQNESLVKLNKIKTNFLSLVSHELRTPMMIIKESIAQVLEGLKGEINPTQKEFLSIGKKNVGRMNNLIENLLDVSKIEGGYIKLNRELMLIVPLIEDAQRELDVSAKLKGINLNVILKHEPQELFIDAIKIAQVFRKLLDNAIKFTPKNGTIDIVVDDQDDQVEVSVIDSGIGIPEEYLSRIFEKFEKLNLVPVSGVASIGLGLAIVKEFVELHGGTVRVSSVVNQGSKFIITLPKYFEDKYVLEYLRDQIKLLAETKSTITVFGFRVNEYKKLKSKNGDVFARKILENLTDKIKKLADKKIREIISMPLKGEVVVFISEDYEESKATDKIFKKIAKGFIVEKAGKEIKLDIALAEVVFPDNAETAELLLKRLEERLYKEIYHIKENVKPLGKMLLDLNLVSPHQLKLALEKQKENDDPLGQILVKMKLISPKKIGKMLEKQLSIPYVDLTRIKINHALVSSLSKEVILRNKVFPLSIKGDILYLAMVNPFNVEIIDELEMLTQLDIKPFITMEDDFVQVMHKF